MCYVFVVVVVLYRCAWRNVNDVLCKRRFFSLLLILKSEMLGYIVCTSGYQRWPLFFCFFPFLLSNIFFSVYAFAGRDVIATRTYMLPKYHSMSAQETPYVNSNMMAYFVFLSSHFSSSFWPLFFFCIRPSVCVAPLLTTLGIMFLVCAGRKKIESKE